MSDLKRMSLVEGEVTLRCRVALLVPEDIADDEEYVKELLYDKAIDLVDSEEFGVEYDNRVDVLVSDETAKKYNGSHIWDDAWGEIVDESRKNK